MTGDVAHRSKHQTSWSKAQASGGEIPASLSLSVSVCLSCVCLMYVCVSVCLSILSIFKTGSHYVTQVGFELEIFLTQIPEFWDHIHLFSCICFGRLLDKRQMRQSSGGGCALR